MVGGVGPWLSRFGFPRQAQYLVIWLHDDRDLRACRGHITIRILTLARPCCTAGDQISSKQLRDDLMTMLVAGHETTAAVLTWTLYLLDQHPAVADRVREEVRHLSWLL